MAPMVVDPDKVRAFETPVAFEAWLAANHDRETELWIRIFKVKSGVASITWVEAVDVLLCWGWIDGIKKSLDADSFLQRVSPRGKKSVWSQINVANVARLIEEGRMTPHGMKHVEAAKADGRWDAAYRIKGSTAPDDLMAAINAEPQARATFDTLTAQNRFALTYRTEAPKTPAGRVKAIARLVEMLKRGETPHPQKRA
ncbi:YdeI/OmpD-associated family protein [Brevundimonas vesicularis]|uniref:YdeI/OmpD-associated family protein n=1 Tax=Brevundimonas vesicularis TaxID=41276 RepID=UPI0022EC4EB9|nr:YdeI/OmpD-associated family protein [Brevundimonas vesicularis]WBT05988.1 YdeI/OmpD-associated family protein [Brevundimonas vesicularis]